MKSPTLKAVDGKVTIVDHQGLELQTVSIAKARELKQSKQIVPAGRPGYAIVTDIPVTTATDEEINVLKRRIEVRKEKAKAERARTRRTR